MEPGGALLFSGIFCVAMIDYIVDANGVLFYSKTKGGLTVKAKDTIASGVHILMKRVPFTVPYGGKEHDLRKVAEMVDFPKHVRMTKRYSVADLGEVAIDESVRAYEDDLFQATNIASGIVLDETARLASIS